MKKKSNRVTDMERSQLISLIDGLRNTYKPSTPIVEALNEIEAILKEHKDKFTAEQILALYPGCNYCNEGVYSNAAFDVTCRYEGGHFCKFCGRPLTDEGVEMIMKRLETIHE